jgi:hypothetical protein
MVCYYHHERQAVGLCMFCHRALCSEDAAVVEEGLACRGRHEPQVGSMRLAERRTQVQAQRAGSGYLRNAIFYGLAGTAFAALGLYQLRWLGVQAAFLLVIGLFLLYAAAANFLEGRRFR